MTEISASTGHRGQLLDTPHTLHHWVPSYKHILLPLLCWWHTDLSLISTIWSNVSCTHLGMDERKSPTTQPGKDWACFPCHSNSTAWFHHPDRLFYNYPTNFDQKSWCNLWWSADLQRAHCKGCWILQVCTTQHQKDQALSDRACCTTSCPGPCHFMAGLQQCSSSWTSRKHNQTSTKDLECSGTTGLQRAQKSPCYTSLYLLALATSCSSHPVQDTDACISNNHRLSTLLLPLTITNLHPLQKSEIC